MTGRAFARLFGGPARRPEAAITQREMDLAASIQVVTEEIMLAMATHVHRETGMKNLCLAGGVALNWLPTADRARGPFEHVWIQPAAGDAGGRLARRCLRGSSCSSDREPARARTFRRDPCSDGLS